ncbi:MAG: uncharacterized protein HLUCCA01_00125 [Bacteroidetes bacterium HLUCCA01]|nr:MAG: uncharacterized protein HLUCCA01_00125 [Bacteroidetes bacterium HLUCCA01]
MASHRSFIMLVLGLLLSGFLPLYGQTFPDRPSGHVNDHGGFLTPEQVRSLETKLRTYRDTTSNVIVIATLPDLDGAGIEETASAMFNTWRMWEGDRQNGVLILASRQERALRIEVGYGLEGAVPDILAGRIVREILTPGFQSGNFYEAFDRSSTVLMDLAAGEFDAVDQAVASQQINPAALLVLLFLFISIFVLINRLGGGMHTGGHRIGSGGIVVMGGGYRSRHWGSGGGLGGGSRGGFGGGGFGGFSGGGGFGSGGGGASGGW